VDEKTLERTIAALIARKDAEANGSTARLELERQIRDLRYSYENAGGIIEEMDPDWGAYSVRITTG
jgi:hypothetical protein